MLLQNSLTLNHQNLINFYSNFKKTKNYRKYKLSVFSIFMHKKQIYFKYFLNKNAIISSSGQLMQKRVTKVKFFKKSIKNFGYTISILNRRLHKTLLSINFFLCKNYNLKTYLWIKKFYYLVKPNINHFIVTQSWNFITKKKRRIKRKIYKNLFKKSKTV